MAEETPKEKTGFEKHITSIIVSLITVVIISGAALLFSINSTVIRMEERDKVRTESDKIRSDKIDKIEATQNTMRMDLSDLKGKVGNLERNDNDRQDAERERKQKH